ncbi:MAG: hypothetical protein MK116_14450 [Phycisphaerales bacterium]|nr:hypothetical protein [Phycisphaerales bacterium]
MNPDYAPKKRPPTRFRRRTDPSLELGEINVSLIEFLRNHPELVGELAPILSRLQQAINGIRITQQDRLTEERRRISRVKDRMPDSPVQPMLYDEPPTPRTGPSNTANLSYEATPKSIREVDRSSGRIRLQISIADYESVTQALERLKNPRSFTAKDLQNATQDRDGARMVPMTQLYLVLRFWRDAQLIERAGGRRFTATINALKKGISAAAEEARQNRTY